MKQVDRVKVCWSCEADVNIDATYCPFCGSDLLASSKENPNPTLDTQKKFSDQTLEESLASLYKPPYSVRNKKGLGVPDEREEGNYIEKKPAQQNLYSYQQEEQLKQAESTPVNSELSARRSWGSAMTLMTLMLGSFLCTLGFLLMIFSNEGKVVLEWNAKFCFFYILSGIPLIYFGINTLKE